MMLVTESQYSIKEYLSIKLNSSVILNEVFVVPLLPHQKRIPLFFHLPRIDDINNIINGYGALSNVGGNYNLSYTYWRFYKHRLLLFTG